MNSEVTAEVVPFIIHCSLFIVSRLPPCPCVVAVIDVDRRARDGCSKRRAQEGGGVPDFFGAQVFAACGVALVVFDHQFNRADGFRGAAGAAGRRRLC